MHYTCMYVMKNGLFVFFPGNGSTKMCQYNKAKSCWPTIKQKLVGLNHFSDDFSL